MKKRKRRSLLGVCCLLISSRQMEECPGTAARPSQPRRRKPQSLQALLSIYSPSTGTVSPLPRIHAHPRGYVGDGRHTHTYTHTHTTRCKCFLCISPRRWERYRRCVCVCCFSVLFELSSSAHHSSSHLCMQQQ